MSEEGRIQVEMMATFLGLRREFGDFDGTACVGNGRLAAIAAVKIGMEWDDAVRLGRALVLATVDKTNPGLLPPGGDESLQTELDAVKDKYGLANLERFSEEYAKAIAQAQ